MIDNPNPNNFYSKQEMKSRAKSIPDIKLNVLAKARLIYLKIEKEEPFPESNIDLDSLVEISDSLDNILSRWSY